MAQSLAFSPCGDSLAISGADGTLNIWDVKSNSLNKSYTPSSHLSASCTCLSWSSASAKKAKKRRRSEAATESGTTLDLLAMGTASGHILLYSVTKGELQSQMSGGHTADVNGIQWDVDSDLLYSCSSDQQVVIWIITTGKIKSRWKADKNCIYSLALTPDKKCLVTASRSIKWWDIATETLIKTFTGHVAEVFYLSCISFPSSSNENMYYVVSAAVCDRMVQVWSLDKNSKDTNAIVSFSLPDEPVHVDVKSPTSREQTVLLSVATKQGTLLVFEQQFNGRQKKPVSPKITFQIVGESNKKAAPIMLPVLASKVCDSVQQNLLFAYGSFLKLIFETQCLQECKEEVMCLVRESSTVISSESQLAKTQLKVPKRSKHMKHLGPEYMVPLQRLTGDQSKKRKTVDQDVTMEEKLNLLKEMTNQVSAKNVADRSLSCLLAQGLQSKDEKILNNVLHYEDRVLVHKTITQLPVQAVIPLMEELTKRLSVGGSQKHCYISWTKTVLHVNHAYLQSLPKANNVLQMLNNKLEEMTSLFEPMSKLKGRLDLLLSQSMVDEPSFLPNVIEDMSDSEEESQDSDDWNDDNEDNEDENDDDDSSDEEDEGIVGSD